MLFIKSDKIQATIFVFSGQFGQNKGVYIMGLFKNLAKVFVDFENANVPESKEDVNKAIKQIQNTEKPSKNSKRNLSGLDQKEAILDIEEIFESKSLPADPSANTVYKVFDILQSPQLKGLDAKTVKTAVMLNLEMNKIPVTDLIEDGKKRIAALCDYAVEKQEQINELKAELEAKNQKIQEEINAYLEAKKAEITANNEKSALLLKSFEDWKKVKEEEESGLSELVTYLAQK